MNGMRAKGWAFRGLARMLLNYPQKKSLRTTTRGDVQMPASIQLIT
jgi:hypothetical protein